MSEFKKTETTLSCTSTRKVIGYLHPQHGILFNACAHALNLDDGTILEPSGFVLNAKPQQSEVGEGLFVTTFAADPEQESILQEMCDEGRIFTMVTSIVGLQAYAHIAGRSLVSPIMTPETARLDKKVCHADKWNVLK